ncbi:hypothetical protein F5Y08DRAFT_353026 [Xylaria arbuscula]|nr:hypothetical protein F5Y08DRAFT_353026 [Xylaria arbuscula]
MNTSAFSNADLVTETHTETGLVISLPPHGRDEPLRIIQQEALNIIHRSDLTLPIDLLGEMNSQALGAGGFLATPSSTVLQPRNPQPALNSTHHLSNSVDTSEARTFEVQKMKDEVQQIRDEMRRMRDEMQQMRDKPVAEVLNHAITSTSIIPTERNIGSYTEVEAVNNHCPAYEPTIPGLIAICDPNPYMKRREEPCASEMDVDREDVSTTIPLKTTSSVTHPGLATSIWNPENPRGKADSVSSSQSTQIRQDINKVAPIATSGLLTGPGLGASRWSGF